MCWNQFLEKYVKGDKEKQPMKNIVQSTDWRKEKRAVNKARRWSEEFNSIEQTNESTNQSMVNWGIG
jgi:hypothetical protein